MIGFALGALLLIGLTLLLLLWPLRRSAASDEAAARRQLNAAIYRDELAELERDHADGLLAAADYDSACAELKRRLLEDSRTEAIPRAPARAASSRATPLALAGALPLAALLLYLLLGNPAAIDPPRQERQFGAADIERMVAGLAAKLEQEPDNLQGWAMLARSYKALGRLDEAVRTYPRAGRLLDENPDLLVDYADTLATQRQGFDQDSAALIDKALKLDPQHLQGLWLRGVIAYDAKRYDRTIADWEALLKLLPAGSEGAQTLEANLAEVRELQAKAKAKRAGKQ
ncbi:MAG: c-type cytochrome biogenesis protein CcmI [Rhodocyclaceae bacterium]|nr:c-type cytochrome biogenesis protein CcmI [Rhodocyclaceae bacterium]